MLNSEIFILATLHLLSRPKSKKLLQTLKDSQANIKEDVEELISKIKELTEVIYIVNQILYFHLSNTLFSIHHIADF